jgi:putative tryptophan/tyrosine transport system substrate-binding protein
VKRREFITMLGGAAVAWPLAARAQQPERVRRIGVLMNAAADDSEAAALIGAFSQGLSELGWSIGRNVRIDYRWYAGNADAARKYAEELVALSPDVILAAGTPGVTAIQQDTDSVPIVFARVSDPVGAGVVSSLARPGGNATASSRLSHSTMATFFGGAPPSMETTRPFKVRNERPWEFWIAWRTGGT